MFTAEGGTEHSGTEAIRKMAQAGFLAPISRVVDSLKQYLTSRQTFQGDFMPGSSYNINGPLC